MISSAVYPLIFCVPRHHIAIRINHVDGVFFDAIHQNVELFGCAVKR